MFDRYDEVAFVGATLGPLFAADPADASSARQVATFAALDVDAAATEWPFVAEERARKSLAAMREGAEDADSEALRWTWRHARAALGFRVHGPGMRGFRRGHVGSALVDETKWHRPPRRRKDPRRPYRPYVAAHGVDREP